jgi:hypothetical protein
MSDRLTLLAGGDAVYVYPDVRNSPETAGLVASQQAMIDIAYPAGETHIASVSAERWPQVRQRLQELGVSIVDTRD